MDDTSRGGPGGAPAGGEGSEPPAALADAETRALPPSSQSSPVFPVFGSPPRGGEETRDPFVDDAPSPPSPRPRIAARAPPRRAKTPPTFEDGVLPRPSADDSPSREETVRGAGKSESAEAKATTETKTATTTTETNSYPLSFLFPGGRLYREPPLREPRRSPEAFDIPDDFERLAVDPEAPEEVRRSTRHRGLRRIAEARAALRVSSKKRSRSRLTDSPPSESGLSSVARGPFFGDEGDEDDEDEDEDAASEEDEDTNKDDDASRTTTTRVLPPESPANPKRPRMLAGIRTPVKGFRTPRANESATVAATMAMADAEAAARSPPRPTPFTVGSVVVIRVGRIDRLRSPRFSSASSYLLPIGFTSRRKYASVASPESRVWYESTVEPGGDERLGEPSPPETTPARGTAKSPPKSPPKSPYTNLDAYDSNGNDKQTTNGSAHSVLVVVRECDSGVTNPATFTGRSPTDAWQKVIRAVNETARTRVRSSVSGPQFLGLSSPVVAAEIAKLPGYAEARAELEERRRRRGH